MMHNADRGWAIIQKLIEQALEKLIKMRAVEGQALAADLKVHCDRIRDLPEGDSGACPDSADRAMPSV